MKIVIFGLTISSSWGNGHATLWRGLCKALIRSGHDIVFYERDVPYYADMRDLHELPGGRLEFTRIGRARGHELPSTWPTRTSRSSPPIAPTALLRDRYTRPRTGRFGCSTIWIRPNIGASGKPASACPISLRRVWASFLDLVLSYSGGRALDEFRTRLGARHVAPLYGHVDPDSSS